jgi:hypothetical protein
MWEFDGFSAFSLVRPSYISKSDFSASFMIYYSIDESRSPAETPIFIAVSILSPVKTHTFTPAALRNWIVSAT